VRQPAEDFPMTRLSRFRACPLCEAICGLELQYEADALVAIRGDAADPFSRGHVCPKGNAILDLEADSDRVQSPLRRRGNDFEPIGWDEAISEAAMGLAGVQARHGSDALAVYLGNPNVHHFGHLAYLPPLLRALQTRNLCSASSVDQWPHQLVDWLMYGHQFLLPLPDIDRTDYLLMLGANPVASNGSLLTAPGIATRLKALAARGRLVLLDPRRTETAMLASEHLFVRPAGDVWFLLAFLQALLRLGPPRIESYAGRLAGLQDALDAISAIDTGDVEARSGIAASTIARLAAEFRAAPTAAAYGRMGVSTQRHGTLCQWLIQLVNLVTGNLDREGGSLPNDPVFPVTGPGTSAGHRDRWRSRVRGLPEFAGEVPVSVLAEEMTTPGPGQVRGLLTCAGNPVLSTPDGAGLSRALGGLDFMVSIDVYVNETTRHANLILPPASFLTQHHYDVYFNAFAVRRVARLSVPLAEPGPEQRADWEILQALGAAYCGLGGKPWKPLPDPRTLIAAGLALGGSGVTIEQLEAAPHGLDLGPLRPSLLRRLQTASGSIECAPALLMDALRALSSVDADASDGTGLRLIGRRHVRSNNSWMHNAPRLVKGKPRHQLLMHPLDLLARELVDGAQARVRSRRGEVLVEVRATDEVMPGVVCLPHGFGHAQHGNTQSRATQVAGVSYNDLTDPEALDGPSGNAALNGVVVTVERADVAGVGGARGRGERAGHGIA
jgi:anaerobic selenocysteine-containing dehydrogenase